MIEYTPEVFNSADSIIIFDTDSDNWDDPDEEQKDDEEQDPIIVRKKLHLQQVRSSLGCIFDEAAFICSKTDIDRDYVVFFRDTIIYGDIDHSLPFHYRFVKNHLGNTILAEDMGIEIVKRHNRYLLSLLPKDLLSLRDIDKIIREAEKRLKKKEEDTSTIDEEEEVVNNTIEHEDYIEEDGYHVIGSTTIYTPSDIVTRKSKAKIISNTSNISALTISGDNGYEMISNGIIVSEKEDIEISKVKYVSTTSGLSSLVISHKEEEEPEDDKDKKDPIIEILNALIYTEEDILIL